MSTATTAQLDERVSMTASWPSVVRLGLREAKRMVRSPVVFVLLGFVLLMGGVETVAEARLSLPSARTAYDVITYFSALYLGLISYLAAHLVTSSARRTGAEPQLAASALSPRQRSAGLCLGVLFGAGVAAVLLLTTAALLGNSLISTGFDGFNQEPPLAGVFLVQLGVTLIGGGLFGVMWATWLRFPGSLPLGFVALIFLTVWLGSPDRAPVDTWPWFMPYITAPQWWDESWPLTGSHWWHTLYLLGLCSLAVCATMLKERAGRGRWLGISAGVFTITAVVGGIQLS